MDRKAWNVPREFQIDERTECLTLEYLSEFLIVSSWNRADFISPRALQHVGSSRNVSRLSGELRMRIPVNIEMLETNFSYAVLLIYVHFMRFPRY